MWRLVEDEDLVAVAGRGEHRALARSRASSTPLWLAASISTDVERSAAAARELDAARAHAARARRSGPSAQLRQRRRMRAEVVLPQPRGPLKR
jgi:hypothetical protein